MDLSSADVGPQVVRRIYLASISKTSRTPAPWWRCRLRFALRQERKTRLRDRVPGHGRCSGAQLDPERHASSRWRAPSPLYAWEDGSGPFDCGPALADELRDACMAVALKLGGWDRVAQ